MTVAHGPLFLRYCRECLTLLGVQRPKGPRALWLLNSQRAGQPKEPTLVIRNRKKVIEIYLISVAAKIPACCTGVFLPALETDPAEIIFAF